MVTEKLQKLTCFFETCGTALADSLLFFSWGTADWENLTSGHPAACSQNLPGTGFVEVAMWAPIQCCCGWASEGKIWIMQF